MKTAFLYAGQGSQKVGMGQDLYEAYPSFAAILDRADTGFDLKSVMFEGPEETLSETHVTQPALAAFAAGVTAVLYEHNIRPEMAAGLSLGEYSALHAAGVFSSDTLIRVTAYRGREMEKAAEGHDGVMCAVMGSDAETIEKICKQASQEHGLVEVANYNTKTQTVIAGEREAVEAAAQMLKEAGAGRCTMLNVSSAFHTSMMAPAGEALHYYFKKMPFGKMQFPVVFNTTARPLEEGQTIPQLLERQVQSSVRMYQSIEYMAECGVDTIIEIGPGRTLSGFVRRTVKGIDTYSIQDVPSLEKVLNQFA